MVIVWILVIAALAIFVYRIARADGGRQGRGRSAQKQQTKDNPYQGTLHAGSGVSLKYEVSVREKTASEAEASELVKEATQKHKEKNLSRAISCLREAYELMAKSSVSYPIETYLRLPLYLQQDGRYADAVAEFEKLINNTQANIGKEFSHISIRKQDGLAAMERATIFDKMRLAAQREKQFVHAVYYQVLSDANRCVGLKLQERKEELDSYKDSESWSDSVDALLAKAKKDQLAEALTARCMVFAKACTNDALEQLATGTAALLGIVSSPVLSKRDLPDQAKISQEQYKRTDEHLQWLGDAVRLHITEARKAWDQGNYDFARQEYQKTAYAMTQIEGQEWAKGKLKEEQAQFAKDDPLYNQLIPIIRARIAEKPGILQTSIYGDIPYQKEDIGYALYFGALLNDVRREKKGRTYALYLPGVANEAG